MNMASLLEQARKLRADSIAEGAVIAEFRINPLDVERLTDWARFEGAATGLRWSDMGMVFGVPLRPDERVPEGSVIPWPQTFWNGEPAEAVRCVVRVGHSPRDSWWCAHLEGQEREAVKVTYGDQMLYLDDENGSGWAKVTKGRGSPHYGHDSLPDGSEVVRLR